MGGGGTSTEAPPRCTLSSGPCQRGRQRHRSPNCPLAASSSRTLLQRVKRVGSLGGRLAAPCPLRHHRRQQVLPLKGPLAGPGVGHRACCTRLWQQWLCYQLLCQRLPRWKHWLGRREAGRQVVGGSTPAQHDPSAGAPNCLTGPPQGTIL